MLQAFKRFALAPLPGWITLALFLGLSSASAAVLAPLYVSTLTASGAINGQSVTATANVTGANFVAGSGGYINLPQGLNGWNIETNASNLLSFLYNGTQKVTVSSAGLITAPELLAGPGPSDGNDLYVGTASADSTDYVHVGATQCGAGGRVAWGTNHTNLTNGITGDAFSVYCNGFIYALDKSGDIGTAGSVAAGAQLEGVASGILLSYAPEMYGVTGSARSNTTHIVQGHNTINTNASCNANTVCSPTQTITFSGGTGYNQNYSYSCATNPFQSSPLVLFIPVQPSSGSGTGFTVEAYNISGGTIASSTGLQYGYSCIGD